MTYREWMSLTCSRFNLTEDEVSLILVNQEQLIGNPDYDVDVAKAKRALFNEFTNVLPMANVSEGGYSLSWNLDAIKLWYKQTSSELGLPDITAPRIRNRSNVW